MNYIVTEKQLKIVKVGVIWNGLVGAIMPFLLAGNKYYDGYSGAEALLYLFILALLIYPILGVNIYAYNRLRSNPTKAIVNLGFGFAIAALFTLNPIGSIITIVGYVRIRRFNKSGLVSVEQQRQQQEVVEVEAEEIDENTSNFFEL